MSYTQKKMFVRELSRISACRLIGRRAWNLFRAVSAPRPKTHPSPSPGGLQRSCRIGPCQILVQKKQIWFSQKPDASALQSKLPSKTGLEIIHSVSSKNGARVYPSISPRPMSPEMGPFCENRWMSKIMKKSKISKFGD